MAAVATIYVRLLGEGVDCWRPVEADPVDADHYRITAVNTQPEDERWQFPTGCVVRCERRSLTGGTELVAVEATTDVPQPVG